MKRLAVIVLAMFAFTAAPVLVLAEEAPRTDHVVLGFEDFMKLWTKAQTPHHDPDKPPVDAAITRAEYIGTVQSQSTEIVGTFEISILAEEKWVRVPFLPSGAGLKEAKLDGAPVPVVTDGGMHALLLKGAGRHTLRVVFSIATGARDGDAQFSFRTAETPITLVTLTFAKPDLEVQIDPAQAISLRNENGTTVAQAILPLTGNVHVAWRRKQPAEQAQPAKLYARYRELITIDDGVLRINLQAAYTLLHAGVNALKVRLPEGVSVLNVTGEGVQGWRAEKGVLIIGFDRRVTGERTLAIQAERPLPADATVAAPFFIAEGVVRQETFIGVEATGNIEVAIAEAKALRQIDVKELPSELWGMARNPLLYGFTSTDAGGKFTLTVTRHADVPVLASTVDSANAVTVLTKDGQTVTRVAFYVRNHLKQFLTLDMPEGSEVWSAFVNGRAVKPSRTKNGQILVPLDKSSLNGGDAAFPVEIVYYAHGSPLGFAGRTAPALPKIDLPTSQLFWSVYAPEELRLVNAGGNVEADYSFLTMACDSVDAMKEEARMDRGNYLASAAKRVSGMMRGVAGAEGASRQAAMEIDFSANAPAADLENHVLPIAFRIPETGHLYRFGKIMVINESPILKLTYVRESVLAFLKALALALSVLLLFRRRHQLKVPVLRAFALGRTIVAHLRPARPSEAAH